MSSAATPCWIALTLALLACGAASGAVPLTEITILFEGSGDEEGTTDPGASSFSLAGANFQGGIVATRNHPPLQASGEYSYEIGPSAGRVMFDEPVQRVEFFFVHSELLGAPAARGGAPGVWLPDRESLVLFGGMNPITADTWMYDAEQRIWEEHALDDHPSARCHHSLVPDLVDAGAILFGGFSFSGRFNDTWHFDSASAEWTELKPGGSLPARRCLHTAARIDSRGEMLVYGGVKAGGVAASDYFEDTYLLDLTDEVWSKVAASGPGKLRGSISFYSEADDAVYLWGGKQVDHYPATLWRFDAGLLSWDPVPVSGEVPLGREDPTFFWHEAEQELYVFSGRNDSLSPPLLDDAYRLDLSEAHWSEIAIQGAPPPRWRGTVALDAGDHRAFLYGGWQDFGGPNRFDDTWIFEPERRERRERSAGSGWSEVVGVGIPPGVATAFDAEGNVLAQVASRPATHFADPANRFALESADGIARIEFTAGVVDDVVFSVPEPSLELLAVAALGSLAMMRHRLGRAWRRRAHARQSTPLTARHARDAERVL